MEGKKIGSKNYMSNQRTCHRQLKNKVQHLASSTINKTLKVD